MDEDYVEQERYHAVVRYSRQDAFDMRLMASKKVQKMHDATLLWDRITQDGAKSLSLIDTELANILSVAGMRPPAIGGNSVALDQSFVREHLPESYAELEMVRDTMDTEGATVVCHSTLNTRPKRNAVCRGWYDRLGMRDNLLRLARAMGLIQWQDPPSKG